MDETSGSSMKDSVGGHNGTVYDVGLGRTGVRGTAYGFNGTSAHVVVPDSPSLDPGAGSFGVRVHVRLSSTPPSDSYDVIRKGTKSGHYWKLEIHANGRPHCQFAGSGGTYGIGGRDAPSGMPSLADGRWHTVKCQKRSDSIALVIDGKSFSVEAAVGSVRNSAASLSIGARTLGNNTADDFYEGHIDEVSIEKG